MNLKRRKRPRRKLRRNQKKRVKVTLWLILSLKKKKKLNQRKKLRKLHRMDKKATLADSLDQMLLRPRNGLVLCLSDTRPISMDHQRT